MSDSTFRPARRGALAASVALAALAFLPARRLAAQSFDEGRLGISAGVATVERNGTGVYASGIIERPLAAPGRVVRMEGGLGWWPVEADRDWSSHVLAALRAAVLGSSLRTAPLHPVLYFAALRAARRLSTSRRCAALVGSRRGFALRLLTRQSQPASAPGASREPTSHAEGVAK
ncbi:MAG: hypothetical protein ACJ8AO_18230 [Gemmatimonadaceae bacterium]